MRVDIITIFPGMFTGPFTESIVKRARGNGIVDINLIDLRDFTTDKHRTVDERPYGGGAGMLMKPEPLKSAERIPKGMIRSTPRSMLWL